MSIIDSLTGTEPEPANGVNIIDASQLVIATINATFHDDPKSLTEDMLRHLIIDTIRANKTAKQKEYPEVVVALDTPSSRGYWRRDIAPYYKRTRAKAREESKFDWGSIFPLINKIFSELTEVYPGIKLISVDRIEADDIIAVLTKKFTLEGKRVLITSSDSDFTQLHKYPSVKQWAPAQKKWVVPKNGSAYADLMYKIIKGDKKDCIAGVKCRSDFFANPIEGQRAPSCTTKWLNTIIDAENPRSVLSDSEQARYDENIMLLDFDKIPSHISDSIITAYETKVVPKRAKLYTYFVQNRLVKLLEKINTF